jgi:hypothetical protein
MAKEDPLEWFPFNVTAWLASESVKMMSNAARGVYVHLLALQWREGSIPNDVNALAKLVDEPIGSFKKIWKELESQFPQCADGRLCNERLERDRTAKDSERIAKSDAGKRGMAKRWGKEKPEKTEEKPITNDNTVINPLYKANSETNSQLITNDNEKEKEKEKENTQEVVSTNRGDVPSVEPDPEPPAARLQPGSNFIFVGEPDPETGNPPDPVTRPMPKSAGAILGKSNPLAAFDPTKLPVPEGHDQDEIDRKREALRRQREVIR